MTKSTDVLIVGGGPAGLAAAIALRQRGIDCVVVEARAPSIDKACGEGLLPPSLAALASLGVHLTASDGHAIRGIRFANPTHRVEAAFPRDVGIGIRRPHLHRLLAERAQQLGATLLFNSRVTLPAEFDTRLALVNGEPLRFRWLIGADGQSSSVRRWAGLDRAPRRPVRYGFRAHYQVDPAAFQLDHVEVHWSVAGQLYLTPVAPGYICVVLLTRNHLPMHHPSRANLLAAFPEVARRLDGASIVSPQRGAVTTTRRLRSVATGYVALIGDASGPADAITGEGLGIAFHQASALAESIAAGSLAPYCRAHRQIARLPRFMASLMLTLDRHPALQVRAIAALAANPRLFRELLAVHIGEANLPSTLLRRAPSLGWNLLARR